MSNEEEKATQEEEEMRQRDEELKGCLFNLKEGPTKEQIEQWKAIHGEVFVSGFSETELFVWRPIFRGEYITFLEQAQLDKLSQPQIDTMILDMIKLFPSKVDWNKLKAGTIDTLLQQVMSRSNFLSPQASSMLVARL
jgi:hypothetical protein